MSFAIATLEKQGLKEGIMIKMDTVMWEGQKSAKKTSANDETDVLWNNNVFLQSGMAIVLDRRLN